MVVEQVSQGIHPEVHSQRIWGPQGPDQPAFPYLAETWVAAVYFIYRHDSHINKSVSFAIKVFRHRRFLHFPMHDVLLPKYIVDDEAVRSNIMTTCTLEWWWKRKTRRLHITYICCMSSFSAFVLKQVTLSGGGGGWGHDAIYYSVHVYSFVRSFSSEFTPLFTTLGTGKRFFITLFCIEMYSRDLNYIIKYLGWGPEKESMTSSACFLLCSFSVSLVSVWH